jgi:hypothetical protein
MTKQLWSAGSTFINFAWQLFTIDPGFPTFEGLCVKKYLYGLATYQNLFIVQFQMISLSIYIYKDDESEKGIKKIIDRRQFVQIVCQNSSIQFGKKDAQLS